MAAWKWLSDRLWFNLDAYPFGKLYWHEMWNERTWERFSIRIFCLLFVNHANFLFSCVRLKHERWLNYSLKLNQQNQSFPQIFSLNFCYIFPVQEKPLNFFVSFNFQNNDQFAVELTNIFFPELHEAVVYISSIIGHEPGSVSLQCSAKLVGRK